MPVIFEKESITIMNFGNLLGKQFIAVVGRSLYKTSFYTLLEWRQKSVNCSLNMGFDVATLNKCPQYIS